MTDKEPDSNDSTLRDRVGSTKESLSSIVRSADEGVRDKLSDAVTVANSKSNDLRSQLDDLSTRMRDVTGPVLDSVKDHIKENDFDVTISGNSIRIEGDEEGLKKVNADLQETFQDKDFHAEYDRDEGLNIELDEK